MIRCMACGETRHSVSLWAQIIDLGKPVVCCQVGVGPR